MVKKTEKEEEKQIEKRLKISNKKNKTNRKRINKTRWEKSKK